MVSVVRSKGGRVGKVTGAVGDGGFPQDRTEVGTGPPSQSWGNSTLCVRPAGGALGILQGPVGKQGSLPQSQGGVLGFSKPSPWYLRVRRGDCPGSGGVGLTSLLSSQAGAGGQHSGGWAWSWGVPGRAALYGASGWGIGGSGGSGGAGRLGREETWAPGPSLGAVQLAGMMSVGSGTRLPPVDPGLAPPGCEPLAFTSVPHFVICEMGITAEPGPQGSAGWPVVTKSSVRGSHYCCLRPPLMSPCDLRWGLVFLLVK